MRREYIFFITQLMKGPFPGQLPVPLSCRSGGGGGQTGGTGPTETLGLMSAPEDGEAAWSLRFIALPGSVKVHLPQQSEAPSTPQSQNQPAKQFESHARRILWDFKIEPWRDNTSNTWSVDQRNPGPGDEQIHNYLRVCWRFGE